MIVDGSQVITPVITETTQEIGLQNIIFITTTPTSFSITNNNNNNNDYFSPLISLSVVETTENDNNLLLDNTSITSSVVDIHLIGDLEVKDLTVCLATNSTDTNNYCLGYLDESENPPQWKCEDQCLKQQAKSNTADENNNNNNNNGTNINYLCGKTTHLTNFAILFEGIAKGGCGKKNEEYVTGSVENDLILSASVAGFVILCAFFILILYCFTPMRKYFMGKEGWRVYELREIRTAMVEEEE